MSQQPKTATDRLANVMQVIQLGKKTGKLIVERENGPVFEQGIIDFVNGRVTQATTGQRQGQEALNWLRSWGPCRFSFAPAISGNTASFPAVRGPGRNPAQRVAISSVSDTSPTLPIPTTPNTPAPQTGQLGYVEQGRNEQMHAVPSWSATPYRTRQIEEGMRMIEQMGLSRTHRRLFLLIDGRRTITELVRLVAHDPEEVYRLLRDLERAGVIQP